MRGAAGAKSGCVARTLEAPRRRARNRARGRSTNRYIAQERATDMASVRATRAGGREIRGITGS